MLQNQDKWLVDEKDVLLFSRTSTRWRNGTTVTSDKCSKGKCQVLAWERNNLMYQYRLGVTWAGSSCADPGSWWTPSWSQKCVFVFNRNLSCIRKNIASRQREVTLPL